MRLLDMQKIVRVILFLSFGRERVLFSRASVMPCKKAAPNALSLGHRESAEHPRTNRQNQKLHHFFWLSAARSLLRILAQVGDLDNLGQPKEGERRSWSPKLALIDPLQLALS